MIFLHQDLLWKPSDDLSGQNHKDHQVADLVFQRYFFVSFTRLWHIFIQIQTSLRKSAIRMLASWNARFSSFSFDSYISELFVRGSQQTHLVKSNQMTKSWFSFIRIYCESHQMTLVDKTTRTTKWLILFFNVIFFVSFTRLWHIFIPKVFKEASF